MNRGGWSVEEAEEDQNSVCWPDGTPENGSYFHAIPKNDLFPHVLSHKDCWCKPTRDEDNETIIVHHSADGREEYEDGRRKMN